MQVEVGGLQNRKEYRNLGTSIAFYKALGFRNNPQFTDNTAVCMVWSET